VSSHRQIDSVYSDLRQAFNQVALTLLLDRLNNSGLSSFYIKQFQSYLSNRLSIVPVIGKFSSPFSALLRVPHGSVLAPLLFNIFINDLSDKIKHSIFLLSVDDMKMYQDIKCV
jgi:membrane-bound metal-dependent hydrolase YbcI (DUF457 family)